MVLITGLLAVSILVTLADGSHIPKNAVAEDTIHHDDEDTIHHHDEDAAELADPPRVLIKNTGQGNDLIQTSRHTPKSSITFETNDNVEHDDHAVDADDDDDDDISEEERHRLAKERKARKARSADPGRHGWSSGSDSDYHHRRHGGWGGWGWGK